MRVTNAQRADLIDALEIASNDLAAQIKSLLPPDRRVWDEVEKGNFIDWNGRRIRYRALRRRLLAEEIGEQARGHLAKARSTRKKTRAIRAAK